MSQTFDKLNQSSADCLLSVIVCTYNRADLLDLSLESLRHQRLDSHKFEVIVVDNNCTDDTAAVVARHAALASNIRRVVEPRQGLSHARNCGWSQAQGRYLVYDDDDAIMPPDYLANVMAAIRNHQPDILGGPVYPFYTTRRPHWFKDSFDTRTYAEGFSAICRVTGCNFIIRKDLLGELGMFDPSLGMVGGQLGLGEEALVLNTYRRVTPPECQRVYYSHDCFIYHHCPAQKMNLRYLLRRSLLNGRTKIRLTPSEIITYRFIACDLATRLVGMMRTFASGVLRRGPGSENIVLASSTMAFIIGSLVESLSQLRQKKRQT